MNITPQVSNVNSLVGAEIESGSRHLLSPQAIAGYEKPEFKRAWRNQVKFHVARQLIRLRRFQKMTQSQLAAKMKTSQPLVAKLESGEENFRADTLERAIEALDGSFDISISPARLNIAPRTPWWELNVDYLGNLIGMHVEIEESGGYLRTLVMAGFRKPLDTLQGGFYRTKQV